MTTSGQEEPLRQLTISLKDEIGADRCTLFFVDSVKKEVWSHIALGLEIAEIRLPIHRGVVGYVARTGQPLNLRDVYNDPRFDRTTDQRTGYRSKSMLTMAIRNDKRRVIGVFQALNKTSGLFTDEDKQTLKRYCDEAAALMAAAG